MPLRNSLLSASRPTSPPSPSRPCPLETFFHTYPLSVPQYLSVLINRLPLPKWWVLNQNYATRVFLITTTTRTMVRISHISKILFTMAVGARIHLLSKRASFNYIQVFYWSCKHIYLVYSENLKLISQNQTWVL